MQRPVDGDAARDRARVVIGGDGGDQAEAVDGGAQHGEAGGVDAVVVGEQDLQGHHPIVADAPARGRAALDPGSPRTAPAPTSTPGVPCHPRGSALPPVICPGDTRLPSALQENDGPRRKSAEARLRRSPVTDAKHAPHDLGGRRLTVRRMAALTAALIAVTFWLGNFFVLYYSFRAPATADVVRQALLGMVLFFLAGLLLGRVQRKNHEMQALLAASSLSDRLTGLYNYGTFVDYLHNEATKIDRYGGELTLIMLDLDHFKQFNDRHGHEPGNDVLRRVGATLRNAVRDADMAARYGGEEFAVLIRGDETHGYELAERLRRAIETTAVEVRDGGEVFCTVSAGVATYPVGAADETELVERADDALYESKRRGRNRVTIYAGVAEQSELPASLSA